ncbi:hypothetical protein ACFLZQ_02320 [Thermodesulfobacteriota bacterium]
MFREKKEYKFLKKKIEKQVLPYVFLTAILILMIWFNTAWSDLSILHFKLCDDVLWYYTLVQMYEGILHFDIRKVFSYPLIYGFIFFLTNLLVTFPFLDDVGSTLSVVLPPIVTSFFAGATLYYILKATRLQKYTALEQIILLSLIILMPGFWYGAGIIHPEFMMTCFLCASIYYLGSSKSLYSREFWKGIVLWGFAIGTKLTAVTFAPAVLGMIIWKWKNKEISFQAALSCLAAIGSVILGLFVILTPYLIYPPGAMKWWKAIQMRMLGSVTPDGWMGLWSLQEKVIKGIGEYFPLSLFFVVLISAIWSIAKAWKTEALTVNTLIALYVLPYTLYLLFPGSQTFSGYYLPTMLLGASLITTAVKEIKAVKKLKTVAVILLFAAVLIQGYSFGGSFIERIVHRMDDKMFTNSRGFLSNELVVDEKSELLRFAHEDAALIKPYVDTDTVLSVSAYTISDYSAIGLTHDKVVTVFGLLREWYFNREKSPSDLIVISKKDAYFSEEWLSKMTNQTQADWRQAKQLIEGWMSGRGEFTLVDQNARLLIFQRKNFSGKSSVSN